ncbi:MULTISPECIES: EamA family transporter [Microbacterium]|uniref:EamA family transporter n=1 Tax=Microbacterium TaxID=33882 RepID=UPI00217EB758|nr:MULTISPECIES: EamA/RhaT family transporter [Microbacterium]UWF76963.1 EamA/RhaT family transporter [Microbacterium neungamense]WCM55123.1 EamA/RhaT family transporter [Microbacterium sp. EF45047]
MHQHRLPHRLLAILAITAASVLWGTTGTAATFASDAGPLAIAAAALGVGRVLQAAVAIRPLREARVRLHEHRALVAAGALSVTIYPLAFYSSMHLAGVAIGTGVSLASAPLASGVLERVVDGARLGRWWVAAAAAGILGSALLCLSTLDGDAGRALWGTFAGILLGLVAGATYAIYSWAATRLMGAGVSRAASMGAVFGIAATTLTLTEPAVAAVLAVLIVGERLSLIGWVGLGLIGLVLVLLVLAPPPGQETRGVAPAVIPAD